MNRAEKAQMKKPWCNRCGRPQWGCGGRGHIELAHHTMGGLGPFDTHDVNPVLHVPLCKQCVEEVAPAVRALLPFFGVDLG